MIVATMFSIIATAAHNRYAGFTFQMILAFFKPSEISLTTATGNPLMWILSGKINKPKRNL